MRRWHLSSTHPQAVHSERQLGRAWSQQMLKHISLDHMLWARETGALLCDGWMDVMISLTLTLNEA